nr:transcription factor Adf-1-like [Onthophagus taurus]
MSCKRGNRLRFTKEEDEKLIREVGNHPVLYDLQNKSYKNFNIKENTWQEISKLVVKSVEECKTRWKSLKDVYFKKERQGKQGTGSEARRINNNWEHMESLAFLEVAGKRRSTITNVSETEDINSDHIDSINVRSIRNASETTMTVNVSESQVDESVNVNDSTNETKLEDDISPVKKRRTMNEKVLAARTEVLNSIKEAVQSCGNPVKTFFDSIAQTVITFPPTLIVDAKRKVLDVISDLELQNCGVRPMSIYNRISNSCADSMTNFENFLQ